MAESIELPNEKDLPYLGFCQCSCGCNIFDDLIPDLYDCSGVLICTLCIKGLCESKENLTKNA